MAHPSAGLPGSPTRSVYHQEALATNQPQTVARISCTFGFRGMTRRIMRGFEASNDALALNLIDQVGPGGEFMSQDVTAKRCRAEIWNPTLLDRQP
jgi:hypothetical protein